VADRRSTDEPATPATDPSAGEAVAVADAARVTSPDPTRRRDAAATRRDLLQAARRRFADQGYAATTVRQVADDAGVNVSLISRYFSSKEGLFEACLHSAAESFADAGPDISGLDDVVAALSGQVTRSLWGQEPADVLRLLLRTSGDENAERVRVEALSLMGQRLADVAARQAALHGRDQHADLLLRAQLVLATALGIAILRKSPGPQPLGSATAAQLEPPLRDLVTGLLEIRPTP
jgi:AcrR family transcriptional regulator